MAPTKTFSETAREEEERVEAEEAETDAETAERDRDGEPEQEPDAAAPPPSPAPPPMTERDAEQGADKLEKEGVRHTKRVREIMGEDFDALLPCPACYIAGFVLPPGTVEYEPEQQAALLALAGVEQGPQLKQDPNAVACEACDGLGFLATGSKRDGFTEQACARCGGQGWHARELPGQAAPNGPPAGPWQALPAPVPTNGPPAPPVPYWDVASGTYKLPGQ